MDNRQSQRGKRKKRRMNNRFYAVLAFLALIGVGVFAFFAVQGLEEGEPQDTNESTTSQAQGSFEFEYNHTTLTYTINFATASTNWQIVDADGLVINTALNLAQNQVVLQTLAPVILQVAGGDVHVLSPRQVHDRIIVIDPGHGGNDHGAEVGDIRESDIVLGISLYLYDIFANSNSGIVAFMTRHDDSFVWPADRARFSNAVGHMFVSVHTNIFDDPSVTGTETLYNPMQNPFNVMLAQIIQTTLVNELGTRDRGIVIRTDLHALNEITIPAVFAEIDFKSNPQALANLTNSEYQQRVAQALYEAIVYAFSVLN